MPPNPPAPEQACTLQRPGGAVLACRVAPAAGGAGGVALELLHGLAGSLGRRSAFAERGALRARQALAAPAAGAAFVRCYCPARADLGHARTANHRRDPTGMFRARPQPATLAQSDCHHGPRSGRPAEVRADIGQWCEHRREPGSDREAARRPRRQTGSAGTR